MARENRHSESGEEEESGDSPFMTGRPIERVFRVAIFKFGFRIVG